MLSKEELREKIRVRVEIKLGFYVHLVVYSVVNVMLFLIWCFIGGFPWFVFPLLGWGVGLFAHFLRVFANINITDRLVEKEYQQLIEKQ